MFEKIVFTKVPGANTHDRLQLLALSTCGFCKRGMEYLREKGFAFEFVFLDEVDNDLKLKTKDEFRNKFGINLSYPSLVKNGESYTLGYIQKYWNEFLGLPPPGDSGAEVNPLG